MWPPRGGKGVARKNKKGTFRITKGGEGADSEKMHARVGKKKSLLGKKREPAKRLHGPNWGNRLHQAKCQGKKGGAKVVKGRAAKKNIKKEKSPM